MAKNSRSRNAHPSYLASKNPASRAVLFQILSGALGFLLVLSGYGQAGPAGDLLYQGLSWLLGWGYWLLAGALFALTLGTARVKMARREAPVALAAFVALLGLVALFVSPSLQGWLGGSIARAAELTLGVWGGVVALAAIVVASSLLIFDVSFGPFAAIEKILRLVAQGLTFLIGLLARSSSVPVRVEKSRPAETARPAVKVPDLVKPVVAIPPTLTPSTEDKKAERASPALSEFVRWRGFPLSLLAAEEGTPNAGDIERNKAVIQRTLASFGIPVEMDGAQVGPTVTQFSFRPADGVKLSRITSLERDLALSLAAHPLRIEAPIPGKSLCGIEIPNRSVRLVRLRNLLSDPAFEKSSATLPIALGRDVNGEAVVVDLSRLPHLLIAGSTGAGKSVAIHAAILSLIAKRSPQLLNFILIDPKRVELSLYEGIPHLAAHPIIEGKRALAALKWLTREMESRYELLLSAGSRDIVSYNALAAKRDDTPLPWIIVMIDELADLMVQYGRELEALVVRLAQMARATGIHLVVSTQRPSVEVLTGLIKANITSRIAFQVASQIDSRTILDQAGAEKLLGRGDMLWLAGDASKPRRLQGAYVSEEEAKRVVGFMKSLRTRLSDELYTRQQELQDELEKTSSREGEFGERGLDDDPLLDEAERLVTATRKASASFLQRRLRVGYARAARLLDLLEARGVVGPGEGAKPRDVLRPAPPAGGLADGAPSSLGQKSAVPVVRPDYDAQDEESQTV